MTSPQIFIFYYRKKDLRGRW